MKIYMLVYKQDTSSAWDADADIFLTKEDVDVYDLDVSDFPDDGEEDEADRKELEFTELSNRPDWGSVW